MLSPGEIIEGRFVVEAPLGAGGMAEVWRVRHARLGTRHACKVLSVPHAELRRRMLREGRLQGRLTHPNVVAVTDLVTVQDRPALVMEMVWGPSLRGLLQHGPLTVPQIDVLARGIFAGVTAAHACGLVHRDLKPGNILLAPADGALVPKIADFGIATLLQPPEGERFTRSGLALGTPAYMAPEQIRDAAGVDERADLWSLGVVLYELICAEPPFHAGDTFELFKAITEGRYRPIEHLRTDIPERWSQAIAATLVPDCSRRVGSCSELAKVWGSPVQQPVSWDPAFSAPAIDATPLPTPLPPAGATMTLPTRPPTEHNLPRRKDAFVGRDSELAALEGAFGEGTLVALLGPGGVGKTRVATEFAHQHAERFPGGLWFCDLAEARTAPAVCAVVATSMRIPVQGDGAIDPLGRGIAARGRCLVILDNLEQVVDAARPVIERWHALAPDASFLVTSRERCRLEGEAVVQLPTMGLADATVLFALRARMVRPTFSLADCEDAVEALVALLDLLPLAIELAAARIRVARPEVLLERMSERFRLLVDRGRRGRRATLRATIDWSWSLLEPWEQSALAQLGVFEGGFTLEAAEAVVSLDAFDGPWVMDALESLADKSLVVMHTGHRFGLLESVRAYAVEKLSGADAFPGSGEPARAAAEGRHGLHYAEFGTGEASEAMERRGGPALWQLLRSETANLTIACERALARGDDSVAVGTCIGLWSIRTRMGPFSDMATLAETVSALPGLTDAERVDIGLVTERALQRAGRGQPRLEVLRGLLAIARRIDDSRLTWRALLAAGRAVGRAGDWDKARLWIREALAIARGAGNRVREAVALNLLAGTYMEHNDLIEAESLLLASAELYRQIGNRSAAFTVMRNLGTLYHNLGRLDESRACLERALEAARELGERASEGVALSQLGYAALAAGRLDEARRRMDAAMPVLERVADRRRLAQALSTRGCVLVEIGQLDAAHADFERALSIERERANRFGEAATLVSAAPLARLRALPEARHRLDQALAIARGLGRRFLESQALYELGCLQLQLGDFEASWHTLAEAATTASEIGAGRTVALAQARQASALLALGKVDDARKHAMLALGTLGAAGGDQDRALAHLILGQVEASACDLEAAASLLSSVEASLADRQPTVEAKAELARLRSALARGPTVPDDGQGGRPVELQ